MNSNPSGNQGSGHAQHGGTATSLGVGGPTSGEAGATPTHETQAETGGSGGERLTRNEVDESGHGASQKAGSSPSPPGASNQGLRPSAATVRPAGDSAMNAHMRGFQDTRSEQAGGSETGLGSPETGANQALEDIERQAGVRHKN